MMTQQIKNCIVYRGYKNIFKEFYEFMLPETLPDSKKRHLFLNNI